MVVVDSVAALTPRAEIEGRWEILTLDCRPDLCRKLYESAAAIGKSHAVRYYNQIREKVGHVWKSRGLRQAAVL